MWLRHKLQRMAESAELKQARFLMIWQVTIPNKFFWDPIIPDYWPDFGQLFSDVRKLMAPFVF